MFWKFNAPSSIQIDALLQKENVTLHELMEEEELLQECKVQNKKLIDFLTQPEILEDLVGLVVNDPPAYKELELRFKHANLASELLTCDVSSIVDKVASSSNLLLMLYKFLEREKPLNPLLASFVSKVFGMLVQRRAEQNWYSYQVICYQVLDFLKSKGEFVEVAVKHIGTSAIMDLLSKFICGVDNDDQEIRRGIHKWLNDCGLIEQLIDKLSPDCDSEEHSSVDQLIQEIIETTNDPASNGSDSQSNCSQSRLLYTLESKEIVNKLMDNLLHEDRNESSVSHVINILLKLLSCNGTGDQSSLHHINSIDSLTGDSDDNSSTVLCTIIARLPEVQKILIQPTKLESLKTSYGTEVERLGSTRLQVIKLIAALIETNNIEVHTKLTTLGTIQLLLDLFFKFSWNNFLHTHVVTCITAILSKPLTTLEVEEEEIDMKRSPSPKKFDGINNNPKDIEHTFIPEQGLLESIKEFSQEDIIEKKPDFRLRSQETNPLKHPLLNQLLADYGLVQKILEIYTKNESAMEENISHNLIGYMGHLREIANTIVSQSEEGLNSVIIKKLFEGLPIDVKSDWENFVEVALAVENLKNKVIPIQIPSKHIIESGDDSDDDSNENFIPCESLVIMNQSYKDGDAESMADMRYIDNNFKETEDHLSGALQRLSSQIDAGVNIDENITGSIEMFDDACAQRISFDSSDFNDMWKCKEKNITFGSFDKSAEEEDDSHSSSEEEGDLDDEFDNLRTTEEKMDTIKTKEEKMEIDFVTESSQDWCDIFDKRATVQSLEENFNPWQSAPASDTADNNRWADFGASGQFDPFSQSSSDGNGVVISLLPNDPRRSSIFHQDFSNILNAPSPPDLQLPLQDICDVDQLTTKLQDNSSSNQKMVSNIDSEMKSLDQIKTSEEKSSLSSTAKSQPVVSEEKIDQNEIGIPEQEKQEEKYNKSMETEKDQSKVNEITDSSDANTFEANA